MHFGMFRIGGMVQTTRFILTVAAMLSLIALPASADSMFTFSGPAGASGTAQFSVIDPTTLTIAITNTTVGMTKIEQSISGLGFSLSGFSGTLALTGVSPESWLDCSSGSCVPTTTPKNQQPSRGDYLTEPYTWTLGGSNPFLLAAGAGSFKPAAIITSDAKAVNGANGGLANAPHNDWMVGPVLFTFTVANGQIGDLRVSDVSFYLGTAPAVAPGTPVRTPEPGFLPEFALFAVMGGGFIFRRLRTV